MLDEILNAIQMGIVYVEEVKHLIRIRPHWVNVVLTGQSAPEEIVKVADTVTETVRVKHHFVEGVRRALCGIDY